MTWYNRLHWMACSSCFAAYTIKLCNSWFGACLRYRHQFLVVEESDAGAIRFFDLAKVIEFFCVHSGALKLYLAVFARLQNATGHKFFVEEEGNTGAIEILFQVNLSMYSV